MELNIVKVDYKGDGKGDNVQKQHAVHTKRALSLRLVKIRADSELNVTILLKRETY